MKTCNKCKITKDLTNFYYSPKSRYADGYHTWCKDCMKELAKKWHAKNSRRLTEYHKDRYYKNKAVILAKQKEKNFSTKLSVFTHYSGGKPFCACCGETAIEFLTIDHIGGGGNNHRKEIGSSGGYSLYRWIIKHNYPDNFRVLCMNCNHSFGHFGYCPHH